MKAKRSHLRLISLGLLAAASWPAPAFAIPVFARRYQTSCVTCHVAFPRLTPFGEAFMRQGYRFPEDDEGHVNQEPGDMELGNPAYRDMFPSAVWPSSMPSIPPLAVVAHGWIGGDPFLGREAPSELSFDNLGANVDLFLAAHLGKRFTVYGKLGVGTGPSVQVQHQRLFLSINDVLPDSTIRVGQFVPEIFQANQSARTCTTCHFSMRRPVGQSQWNYGSQVGVEIADTVAHRLRYVVGVVEGNGNQPNLEKDFYVRLAAKLGGLSLDGRSGGTESSDNWVDNSVELGVFGYYGNAELATADEAGEPVTVRDRFFAAGGDVFATWRDVGLYGLALHEVHGQPTYADKQVRVERYVGRLRYVFFPWLVPEATFEYFNTELDQDMTYQVMGTVDLLVRANMKVWLEVIGRRNVRAPFEFSSARAVLDVGF
ncbi:MAG: hypothetical protein HYY06_21625 [Deltaproteobacteria bacterium]|nr:hypothetical protein [Deltaproteobacteria bacterium]